MTTTPRRLLPRQILFAAHCLTEPSATQAAIRAGYSPRSARNQAHRLLANDDIRRRIAGELATARAGDAERRERVLDLLEHVFGAAMAAGRLEPALHALKIETEWSGILLRGARLSGAQRAELRDADADDPLGPLGPIGRPDGGKL